MVLPPSVSRKMGEIETVEAEKMGWLNLLRGTSYPTFPYYPPPKRNEVTITKKSFLEGLIPGPKGLNSFLRAPKGRRGPTPDLEGPTDLKVEQ